MTINIRGTLFGLAPPQVMGILNVTPDSFYAKSRSQTEEAVRRRAEQIVAEGGSMIDLGACSTRPGATDVSPHEEMERLRMGMKAVRQATPDTPVSIDTFRADVAKMAVEELGADIINDISGGQLDPQMFPTVARLGVPYVLMHNHPTPHNPSGITARSMPTELPPFGEWDGFLYFATKIQQLRDLGQKDIILDPGYGFAKTQEQNYQLLRHQEQLQIFQLPLLVGLSRKSMIHKCLGITPSEALNGTTVLNTIVLTKGADILRVHDVRPAVEAVKLINALRVEKPN